MGRSYTFTSFTSTMDELFAGTEECMQLCKKAAIDGTPTPLPTRWKGKAKSDPTLPLYATSGTLKGKVCLKYKHAGVRKRIMTGTFEQKKAAATSFIRTLACTGKT